MSARLSTENAQLFSFPFMIRRDRRRRIDEMKSSANASNRQGRSNQQQQQPQQQMTPLATGRGLTLPVGSAGILRPGGGVPSNSSGLTVAGSSAAAAAGDVLVDQEERQALHETKKAIDHLKSVTGIMFRYFHFFGFVVCSKPSLRRALLSLSFSPHI